MIAAWDGVWSNMGKISALLKLKFKGQKDRKQKALIIKERK